MKHIHFIAIGGAVMHQLALALQRQGHQVTGSDDEINDPAKSNLAAAGILPGSYGWFPEKIHSGLDAIVLGMHAKGDNPELLRAKELAIPIYSFPEYMYEVSKDKQRVVIAGSHGKTTITSMVMHILKDQGRQFDYLVGARVAGFDQSVQLSNAPLIVLEGDEYPASVIEKRPKIFFYHPHITVLSGIAWDHINVFPTYEFYCSQFDQYLTGIDSGSQLFFNEDDPEVVRIVKQSAGHLNAQPYRMPAFHYEDGVAIVETAEGALPVNVFGRHNLQNMMAAVSVCEALGISRADALKSIAGFKGAARRLEKLFETDRITAFRDFAHAPSKLRATLDAVREAYPDRELIACFELHTYSSLNDQFLSEYKDSMNAPDKAIVYFSHHAISLKGLPTLSRDTVFNNFGRQDLIVADQKEQLEKEVRGMLANPDRKVILLLMSSGTFDGIDWNAVSSQ
ncbi:MAG: peptidoglycan synthetase [Sphingobacteriales bacterium]|nr:MAG: peptidoglycan synthetase [Sphingobacteriales bacterium]